MELEVLFNDSSRNDFTKKQIKIPSTLTAILVFSQTKLSGKLKTPRKDQFKQ